jgi:hypothetical protein
MVVFQSLTTPGGIRLPNCQGNTKSVRTSSFICCRKWSCHDIVGGVMSKIAYRVSCQVVGDVIPRAGAGVHSSIIAKYERTLRKLAFLLA